MMSGKTESATLRTQIAEQLRHAGFRGLAQSFRAHVMTLDAKVKEWAARAGVLQGERDEVRDQFKAVCIGFEEMRKERDELLGQVARLRAGV
jgi:uncharacterized coiled-coil DUF342 family protein